MAVSKRLRYEILRRDNFACKYCGAAAPDVKLTVDHVIPEALGGTDDPSNLVTACAPCNSGKSSSSPDAPLVADVAADALRWAAAMARATEIRRADLTAVAQYVTAFDRKWQSWHMTEDKTCVPRPSDWADSAEQWQARGIDITEIEYAIDTAMRRRGLAPDDVWRYMCGIVWKRQTAREELARELLNAGPNETAPLVDLDAQGEYAAEVHRLWLERFPDAPPPLWHLSVWRAFQVGIDIGEWDAAVWSASCRITTDALVGEDLWWFTCGLVQASQDYQQWAAMRGSEVDA